MVNTHYSLRVPSGHILWRNRTLAVYSTSRGQVMAPKLQGLVAVGILSLLTSLKGMYICNHKFKEVLTIFILL